MRFSPYVFLWCVFFRDGHDGTVIRVLRLNTGTKKNFVALVRNYVNCEEIFAIFSPGMKWSYPLCIHTYFEEYIALELRSAC